MKLFNFFFKRNGLYVGVRYSATGVFGYSYRNKKKKEVFNINCLVAPNPNIYMYGFDKELIHKQYDGQITLLPGLRRNIVDKSGETCGYYEYTNLNKFRIVVAGVSATVKVVDNGWAVFKGRKKIANIRRISKEKMIRYEENGYDMELCFEVSFTNDATPLFYPYIFAIPMLGF